MGKHSKPDPTPKCPNGHDANSSGNCAQGNCVYSHQYRHRGGQ